MQKKFTSTLICFVLFFTACHTDKKPDPDKYSLQATETLLSFPLDEETKIYIFHLHTYTDPNGEEYLVFQNRTDPQLLFYNIQTQRLYKKITCDRQGPDAVQRFSGFSIKDMNEIYLVHSYTEGMSVIDGEGKPLHVYENKTKEGVTVKIDGGSTSVPINLINDKLYIPLSLNREYGEEVKFQKSNLCATFDLKTQELKLLPLTHLAISEREGEDLIVLYYSRCTNGKQFVYSFEDSEDLFVTDLEHTTLKRIRVKSKYLPDLKFKSQEVTMAGPTNCIHVETPHYGAIFHDPYRKVYYWIAYPKAKIEKGINCLELRMFGGKNFSIIVLNEDLEIIGETLMPDYIYNPELCFVRKDGFYISESHILNPNFDENQLCFRRLELVKKK